MLETRFALVLLIVSTSQSAQPLKAQRLGTGMVVSTNGAPLDRVWVQELGTRNGTLTKSDGAFPIPLGKAATLLLSKDGFRPEIVLTTGKEAERTVVMQPETEASRMLPSCRRKAAAAFPEVELARTPHIRMTHGREVDFSSYVAKYTRKDGAEDVLSNMTGVHAAGLTPTPDWVKGLSSLSVRSLKCADVQWIDLRGVSEGGLQSRWLGYGWSYVEYSRVSKDAAHAFDSAIDHGCCRLR